MPEKKFILGDFKGFLLINLRHLDNKSVSPAMKIAEIFPPLYRMRPPDALAQVCWFSGYFVTGLPLLRNIKIFGFPIFSLRFAVSGQSKRLSLLYHIRSRKSNPGKTIDPICPYKNKVNGGTLRFPVPRTTDFEKLSAFSGQLSAF